ncbi:hypothetical protein BOTCAL_0070g00100 [Botryotinia calthae]|uniref:C2H2-type domain-containing protein n=1 Tax=Botryotinia calthae TaxID=38488 RepID=A0A4Y8D9C8_9HELO|nr:hypothetical protein BOTCAL_0070g00100 [Botryotinia calthae]
MSTFSLVDEASTRSYWVAISIIGRLDLCRTDDFYDNPLDFTYFDWDNFEHYDNDPCSEFLNFFNDEPSSESHQDTHSIPLVTADTSPFIFPFETLQNASVDGHQDMGSNFSHPRDEPYYTQPYAETLALDNSVYNQTDLTSNSYSSLSANVSFGSFPQESSEKKTTKDAKYFCTICRKGCHTKAILRRHLKIHDPNLRCDFPGCSQKPFAENRDLERHRASHGIIGPLLYFCSAENCDMAHTNGYKGSVRADNIKRHITRRHPGQDIQVFRMEQHLLPPYYTTTYDGRPSAYHESALNTYDYHYPNSVSQDQWFYGRGLAQPSYSPLISYHEQTRQAPLQYQRTQQTQWQQSESPQRYVNSVNDYEYSNYLQQQERALREQIAYEQASSQQFLTSPYIISSDGQNMRNRFPSRRLTDKLASEHIISSTNSEKNIFSREDHIKIDVGELTEPSKPVSTTLMVSPVTISMMDKLNFEKMSRRKKSGKVTLATRGWGRDAEKDKSSSSMSINRGISSDFEEVSGAKFTRVSKFLSKAERQLRREAWSGPEQFLEAESTMNESILITSETGHVKTVENATPTQRQSNISKISNYFNSNELDLNQIIQNPKLRHDVKFDPDLHFKPNLDGERGQRKNFKSDVFWKLLSSLLNGCLIDRKILKQDETFPFSSEQVNEYIDPMTLSTLYARADFGFETTYYSFQNGWFFVNSLIPILSIIWVVVPTVYGKKWRKKISSKQPFDFLNLHSGI